MQRTFKHTTVFDRIFDKLIAERKLSQEDFESFEQALMRNPEMGDPIPGMAGLRKLALNPQLKGKGVGFALTI